SPPAGLDRQGRELDRVARDSVGREAEDPRRQRALDSQQRVSARRCGRQSTRAEIREACEGLHSPAAACSPYTRAPLGPSSTALRAASRELILRASVSCAPRAARRDESRAGHIPCLRDARSDAMTRRVRHLVNDRSGANLLEAAIVTPLLLL